MNEGTGGRVNLQLTRNLSVGEDELNKGLNLGEENRAAEELVAVPVACL